MKIGIFNDFERLQKALPIIEKNCKVSFNKVNFRYTDLAGIHKVIKPLLAEYNFVLSYIITNESVTCVLHHVDGESITSAIEFKPSNDPKQTGSLITYYKRYLISGLLAIDTEDDVDVKVVEERKKAQMSNKAFEQAKEKIANKQTDVIKKCLLYFEMTQAQHDELLNLDLEING